MTLRTDYDHEDEPLIILIIEGNQVEVLYNFVHKLIDLNVSKAPLGDDMSYMYINELNVTHVIFKGKGWVYSVAQLYSDMEKNVVVKGWSNWHLPFIEKGRLVIPDVDLDMLSEKDFPGVGSLHTIGNFIQAKIEVERGDPEDTKDVHDALNEARKEMEDAFVNVDDDHV